MSIIISLHRYDGISRYSGTYVHTLTLGYITLTVTRVTIEDILRATKP